MKLSDLLLLVVFGPALVALGCGVLLFLVGLVAWALGRDDRT